MFFYKQSKFIVDERDSVSSTNNKVINCLCFFINIQLCNIYDLFVALIATVKNKLFYKTSLQIVADFIFYGFKLGLCAKLSKQVLRNFTKKLNRSKELFTINFYSTKFYYVGQNDGKSFVKWNFQWKFARRNVYVNFRKCRKLHHNLISLQTLWLNLFANFTT